MKRRHTVGELQEIMGAAKWTNDTKKNMAFTDSVEAMILCGELIEGSDENRYLMLKWLDETHPSAVLGSDDVPKNLNIGRA